MNSAPMFERLKRSFALVLCSLFFTLPCRAEAPFSFESTPGQLPKTVVPTHYTLRLEPDLQNLTTRGSVIVDLNVRQPVREIVLNALDLEVSNAILSGADNSGRGEFVLSSRLDPAHQTLVLTIPGECVPGKYRLAIEFTGRIVAQAQGLFYVKYPTPSGKKVMLGTQMEPTDARRMFPCWDEPVFRASYDLTVVVPEKHKPISNTPIEREIKLNGGLKEVKFRTTPSMASYLVVFVSGELEELKGSAQGTEIRIITTEGKKEQGREALDDAETLLAYYNRYFGVKYPLPKLDLIAIPGGYTGAMENWGAITFNERHLLYDPKISPQRTRQSIFGIVAHEMAHQWFGNLVTTAWWDNLWLNEGFASWMSGKATDHFHPEWQNRLTEISDTSGVMNADARKSTHPIQQPVKNESQANDAFDYITYRKGRAFLHMLENYLGEEPFRRGIHQYLLDHSYSNSTTADLWFALEKSSGKPVKAISAGWTEQPGLPVVRVHSSCAGDKRTLTLEQERFTILYTNAPALQWQIPIGLTDLSRASYTRFSLLESPSNSVPAGTCATLTKLNPENDGYYRVWYEPEIFTKLAAQIEQLSAGDQLSLLNDTWAMTEADRGPSTDYLELVQSVRSNKTYAVWDQIFGVLGSIDQMEFGLPGRAAYRDYVCRLLRPQLQRLGWDPKQGESIPDTSFRRVLIGYLGWYGDQAVIAEARTRFEKFVGHPDSLSTDIRPSVLTVVGRYADRKTWDQLHDLALKSKGVEERQMFYDAMAGATDPELAKAMLALSLTDETVPQETTYFVIHVAAVPESTELAWNFAREHMKELLPRLETFRRNTYVPGIMSTFTDPARADELEAYVKANISEDAMFKAHETAEGIRQKAALKQRELPRIDEWISAHPAQ